MSNRSYVHLRDRLLAESSVEALAETFRVLGDMTRVRMLDALSRVQGAGAAGLKNGLCVQDLAALVGLTPSAVSHQLRLLRSMRLVRARRDGRLVFYALDDDHIVKLVKQGLEHVEEKAPAGVLARHAHPSVAGKASARGGSLEPIARGPTPRGERSTPRELSKR